MKIEIIMIALHHLKVEKSTSNLFHWSAEGFIKKEKMTSMQSMRYVDDYIRDNNMRILFGNIEGLSVNYILVRE